MTDPLPIIRIVELIKQLRGEEGCPWDQQQTPGSISVYLIEEVYELVNAIESNRPEDISEELGDVLFQLIFILCLFEEKGVLDIEGVIAKNVEKMERRHPHVFGAVQVAGPEAVREQWQRIKAEEKEKHNVKASLLDTIPFHLPALMRAYRVSERASQTGFDWTRISEVIEKVEEELAELKTAMVTDHDNGEGTDAVASEIGDLMFTIINLARFARVHPETALTAATQKFERRFRRMEAVIAESGDELESVAQREKDLIWERAKKEGL